MGVDFQRDGRGCVSQAVADGSNRDFLMYKETGMTVAQIVDTDCRKISTCSDSPEYCLRSVVGDVKYSIGCVVKPAYVCF